MSQKYAVIDVGSNTIRLVIFQIEDGSPIAIIGEKVSARLSDYTKERVLSQDGIDRACEALAKFRDLALCMMDIDKIFVFATASLRGLKNQDEAVAAIIQRTGLVPQVLTGVEEASIGFYGASHFMTDKKKTGIFMDIGGASSEVLLFEKGKIKHAESLNIGSLNMYSRFVAGILPTESELLAMTAAISKEFDRITWLEEEDIPMIVGIGGTIRGFRQLALSYYKLPRNTKKFATADLDEMLTRLKAGESKMFKRVCKHIPRRALTITPGLMILDEAIRRSGAKKITISNYGLREGYLMKRVNRREKRLEKAQEAKA